MANPQLFDWSTHVVGGHLQCCVCVRALGSGMDLYTHDFLVGSRHARPGRVYELTSSGHGCPRHLRFHRDRPHLKGSVTVPPERLSP